MKYINNEVKKTGISQAIARIEVYLATKPEWWVWGSCLLLWGVLFITEIIAPTSGSSQGRLLICTAQVYHQVEESAGGILKDVAIQKTAQWSLVNSMFSWFLMIWAMMFPLLRKSIRHVALSVRHKDREIGILLFLLGYTIVWSIAGLFYTSLPQMIDFLFNSPSYLAYLSISIGMLIALAFRSWMPSREIVMMQCELTAPIRIRGWRFMKDSVFYGIQIGVACLRMCGLMMLALTLGQHSFVLMALFTIIALVERYFVPHESKVVGYSWLLLAAGISIYSYIY